MGAEAASAAADLPLEANQAVIRWTPAQKGCTGRKLWSPMVASEGWQGLATDGRLGTCQHSGSRGGGGCMHLCHAGTAEQGAQLGAGQGTCIAGLVRRKSQAATVPGQPKGCRAALLRARALLQRWDGCADAGNYGELLECRLMQACKCWKLRRAGSGALLGNSLQCRASRDGGHGDLLNLTAPASALARMLARLAEAAGMMPPAGRSPAQSLLERLGRSQKSSTGNSTTQDPPQLPRTNAQAALAAAPKPAVLTGGPGGSWRKYRESPCPPSSACEGRPRRCSRGACRSKAAGQACERSLRRPGLHSAHWGGRRRHKPSGGLRLQAECGRGLWPPDGCCAGSCLARVRCDAGDTHLCHGQSRQWPASVTLALVLVPCAEGHAAQA